MAVLLVGTVLLFPEPTTVAGSRGEPLVFNYVRDILMEDDDPYKPRSSRLDPLHDAEGNFLPLPQWLPSQPQPADWPSHIYPPRDVAKHQKEAVT